jgi:hypothetical protein
MPVIVWGETGCSFNGLVFSGFLTEIASHGVIIFANGSPTGKDNPNGIAETSNPDGSQLKSSVDFIIKFAGTGKYTQVDPTRIAAAGQSCGGMQAYMLYDDPRVSAIGIFNSGFIDAKNTTPSKITKPIFYFLGGSTDIAFANVCLSSLFIHTHPPSFVVSCLVHITCIETASDRVNVTMAYFRRRLQSGWVIRMLVTWQRTRRQMGAHLVSQHHVGRSGCSEVTRRRQTTLQGLEVELRLVMAGRQSVRRWRRSLSNRWRHNCFEDLVEAVLTQC